MVVDDDYYFRIVLEKTLAHIGHQPQCAENAKHAQQLIGLDPFDLVISDIRMPEMNGVQLLHWIKSNRPMPVILMTGFSEIAETCEAAQLGADGFLAKPFKREDLLQVIRSCFPPGDEKEEIKNIDSEFCKIGIDDFISGKEMKFDIYIRMTPGKYIKIAHSGEDIAPDRIQSYKSKNIQFLFMKKEDFRKYLNFNLSLATIVTKSQKIDHKKKVNFLMHTTEVMLQQLYTSEISREDYLQAQSLVENAVSLLCDNSDAADLLCALTSHSDFLYAHSVAVSLYSSLIGKAMEWSSPTTVIRLSLGGLLHDVGKKEISREILEKPRMELTPDEIALFESHPKRGAEILAQLQCIPTDILQIAHEHHENCVGTGYPMRLRKTKITPLARVVSVANDFCNWMIKNPNSPGLKPVEAIHRMLSLNPGYYDEAPLRALMQIFNIQGSVYGDLADDRD